MLQAQRRAARVNAIYGLGDALSSRLVLLLLLPVVFAGAAMLSLSRSGAAAVASGLFVWMLLALPRERSDRPLLAAALRDSLVFRATVTMGLVAAVAFFVIGLEPLADRWGRVGEEFDATLAGSRGQIWSDTWRIAADFPLTGGGLGSFYGLYLPYASAPTSRVPIYAHEEYLQLLAETGVPGAAMALMVMAGIALAGWRKVATATYLPDRALYAGVLAGLLAIAFQSLAEFSLRIPLNAALAALMVGLLLHDQPPGHS
jgi:O-antigen ligase